MNEEEKKYLTDLVMKSEDEFLESLSLSEFN